VSKWPRTFACIGLACSLMAMTLERLHSLGHHVKIGEHVERLDFVRHPIRSVFVAVATIGGWGYRDASTRFNLVAR
jgi:hypothetical protein